MTDLCSSLENSILFVVILNSLKTPFFFYEPIPINADLRFMEKNSGKKLVFFKKNPHYLFNDPHMCYKNNEM